MPGPLVTRHTNGDKSHLPGDCKDSQRGPVCRQNCPFQGSFSAAPNKGTRHGL